MKGLCGDGSGSSLSVHFFVDVVLEQGYVSHRQTNTFINEINKEKIKSQLKYK